MEPDIRRRMTPDLLAQGVAAFGATSDDLRELDGFESFIYETAIEAQRAVIRIGHSSRRPVTFVLGELDWMEYLSQNGIGVPTPILAESGEPIATVDDGEGEQFVVAAFTYAPGHPPTIGEWAPPFWQEYGALMGRIHSATSHYVPARPGAARPAWEDDIGALRTFLPDSEVGAQRALDTVLEHLATLPRESPSFGLIHGDAHAGNLHVTDEGAITLFDFDDCTYSWLVNDLALVAFYALSWVRDGDPAGHIERFWSHFWPAYRDHYDLDAAWLEEIPWFMKLRELDTYAVIHRSMDPADIDDPWARWFMSGRKERIGAGIPVVDFDFPAL